MKNSLLTLALVVFSLLFALPLHAQTIASSATSSTEHAPDPDPGTIAYAQGLFIPFIAGHPFRAKVEVETVRQLPDGTTVAMRYFNVEARDGAGRGYRESREAVRVGSDKEPALAQTRVYDTVARLITICQPVRMTCQQMTDPMIAPKVDAAGASFDGKSVLTRESLGTKTMDGLDVVGTRETRTYAAGAFGNDKPLVATKEIWYSPELDMNLSVTRFDPRTGTQRLTVTELKLGEPGAEWFAIPEGYSLAAQRAVENAAGGPAELAPLLAKDIAGMSADELAVAAAPVDAAIGAYARAHAAAEPNDKNDTFAGLIRTHFSSNLRMLQVNPVPRGVQPKQIELQMNEVYRQVLESPCLEKTAPGDPPTMPVSAAALGEEEQAWVGLRDAWVEFVTKLYPNGDKSVFAWVLTGERLGDLRRMQAVERNRGCVPEETMEPQLEGMVPGMTPEQLAAALKPVDAALNAYVRAHAESAPRDTSNDFTLKTEQALGNDLRTLEQSKMPTREQLEKADLRLNQTYRAVIASPCLSRPGPSDPADAPVSEEKLRAEERAWMELRDAWSGFLAAALPGAPRDGFGTALTEMRAEELGEIRSMEMLRGCKFSE